MVVPISAKKFETAYLSCRADVFSDAGADVVVAYAHQSDGVGSIVGQPVEADTFGQVITCGELEGDRQVFVYQAIHLLLYLFLFLPTGFVVEIETHLALLALDVGIV